MMRRIRKPMTKRHTRRRGNATLWVIIASPAMLAMLVLVSDVANLWLARVEVENAAEAGALAAANVWGDGPDDPGNRTAAHQRAKELVEANLVVGQTLSINDNNNAGNVNNNAATPADVMLGSFNAGLNTFDASAPNPIAADQRACYVTVSVTLNSLWLNFAGPFTVRATSVARYDSGSTTAVLVYLDPADDPTSAP